MTGGAEEEEGRASAEVLARCMARLYAGGLTTSSGGNLSTVDGAGTLWITPRGTDKGALAAADVVALRPPWDAGHVPAGARAPSTELPLHRRIYAARRGVRAVLHAHPPALVACAVAGVVPATCCLAAAAARCGTLRHIPYAMPGTAALAQLVSTAFATPDEHDDDEESEDEEGIGRACFVLMGHHGVVAGGATLPGLLAGLEALECAATLLVHARQLAALAPTIGTEDLQQQHAHQQEHHAFPADIGRDYVRAAHRALASTAATRTERTGDIIDNESDDLEKRCRDAGAALVAFARRLVAQRLAPAHAPCALSVRIDARRVLCSDSATPLCELAAHTLVVLDVATLAWHALSRSSGGGSTPARQPHWRCSTVHAAVYRRHACVGAVLSSEGVPCVLAFAAARVLGAGRAPAFAPAAIPEGHVALRRVATVDGAAALADPACVAAALDPRTAPVCVAAHDCVHAVGATLLHAYDRLEVAEALARSQCLCAALGAVPAPLSPADIAALDAAYPPV